MGPSIGVAVELGVALLPGDALAGSREAILVSLVVLVRIPVPLFLRHHRGAMGRRIVSPGRLDCCTGRARLEKRKPLLAGGMGGGRVREGVVLFGRETRSRPAKSRHKRCLAESPASDVSLARSRPRPWVGFVLFAG
jgi:hypothetical protein